MEHRIRELAVEMLESRRVDMFIGYEKGTVPMTSRPVVLVPREGTPAAEQAAALVWNSFCRNNLAVYLAGHYRPDPRRKPPPKANGAAAPTERPGPRIGMVVKGCDLRSITTLLKEKQVPREKLVLIGVPCRGMVDPKRVRAVVGAATEIVRVVDEPSGAADGMVEIVTEAGQVRARREEVLVPACKGCRYPVPAGTDHLLEGPARAAFDGAQAEAEAAAFDGMTLEQRWSAFRTEMAKCIRCNACRQACPSCYCKECFADQTDIRWIGAGTDISDVMLYHLVRVFHQAGRCAECDACAVACPMDVDLRMLTRRMAADVRELFDFETSFDTEAIAPIATFSESDDNSFITEP